MLKSLIVLSFASLFILGPVCLIQDAVLTPEPLAPMSRQLDPPLEQGCFAGQVQQDVFWLDVHGNVTNESHDVVEEEACFNSNGFPVALNGRLIEPGMSVGRLHFIEVAALEGGTRTVATFKSKLFIGGTVTTVYEFLSSSEVHMKSVEQVVYANGSKMEMRVEGVLSHQ